MNDQEDDKIKEALKGCAKAIWMLDKHNYINAVSFDDDEQLECDKYRDIALAEMENARELLGLKNPPKG